MELNEHGFFEEFLALKTNSWETLPSFHTEMSELFPFDCFLDNQNPVPSYFLDQFSSPIEQDFNNYYFNGVSCPFGDDFSTTPQFTDEFSAPQFTDSSYNNLDTPPFPVQEDTPLSITEDLEIQAACKVEQIQSPEMPVFNIGSCPERKMRGKKLEGQPSKNLMAERRRRKRLNDRLSMLRSIVPKISKMDRTSIVGDTIDYVKELMERINNLQQEIEVCSDQMGVLKNTKASEFIVRNSPKFDVERGNDDTRIEISCAAKPGLLLTTVNTLETLGLEIQQCVISCFNDFSMQVSCSEEQRRQLSSEDIKQALFRSAGYGGRCP